MPTVDRSFDRGSRRAHKALRDLGEELRTKRVTVGLSQLQVASAAGIARPTCTRIEAGRFSSLSLLTASRVASVLGLDLSVRVYPGGNPLRDAAQLERLDRVLSRAAAPLESRTEVPLPATTQRPYEQRAWDAELRGEGKRTTLEMEMRITDAQDLERRIELKRRDDPSDSFVLLITDTSRNRRVLRGIRACFPD
ncbi:MAG: helix-turn-helix transcriptional regulator [Candidatus Limnocylindrales bacterium]